MPSERAALAFATTHWSIVLRANAPSSSESTAALETLCRTYWPPLYAFVLRQGHPPEEAQDLTQEFFSRLLDGGFLPAADPERGRFRSYLLGAFRNFLAVEWKAARRLKRGGGHAFLSVEELAAAEQDLAQPGSAESAEELYDRRWAEAVLARVLERLGREWADSGQATRFEALKGFLADDEGESYAALGVRLGLSENGVASAVHRLRRRYVELFREEIAHTVDNPAEIAGEIRYLCALLAKG